MKAFIFGVSIISVLGSGSALAQFPVPANGVSFEKMVLGENGESQVCEFAENGITVYEYVDLQLPGDKSYRRYYTSSPLQFSRPADYYTSLGEVHRLRTTYSENQGAGKTRTQYFINTFSSDGPGGDMRYPILSKGTIEGRINSPKTDEIVALIEKSCSF